MAIDLIGKRCMPCEGGVPPIKGKEIDQYLTSLESPWEVLDEKKIKKIFIFEDFKQSISFVNKVASLAEDEGHHPDILIMYNKVTIELWTHAIMGLSENDFILAAKIEKIAKQK
jgi:4a-hydroxytetrahydrobiopterin dehydratase